MTDPLDEYITSTEVADRLAKRILAEALRSPMVVVTEYRMDGTIVVTRRQMGPTDGFA